MANRLRMSPMCVFMHYMSQLMCSNIGVCHNPSLTYANATIGMACSACKQCGLVNR